MMKVNPLEKRQGYAAWYLKSCEDRILYWKSYSQHDKMCGHKQNQPAKDLFHSSALTSKL